VSLITEAVDDIFYDMPLCRPGTLFKFQLPRQSTDYFEYIHTLITSTSGWNAAPETASQAGVAMCMMKATKIKRVNFILIHEASKELISRRYTGQLVWKI
jgi:hypothetical protein